MPPKKQRKQMQPKRTKQPTEEDKLEKEIANELSKQKKKGKKSTVAATNKKQNDFDDENSMLIEEVKNTPTQTQEQEGRLHHLVRTRDNIKQDPDRGSDNVSPDHPVLNKSHSDDRSDQDQDDEKSDSGDNQSEDEQSDGPKSRKQRQLRQQRYEKRSKSNASRGGKSKTNIPTRSKAMAASKKQPSDAATPSESNTSQVKQQQPTVKISLNLRSDKNEKSKQIPQIPRDSNHSQLSSSNQSENEIGCEPRLTQQMLDDITVNKDPSPIRVVEKKQSTRSNRPKSINKGASQNSSGITIKSKKTIDVPSAAQVEDSIIQEEVKLSEKDASIVHQRQSSKDSVKQSPLASQSSMKNEEVKDTLILMNQTENMSNSKIQQDYLISESTPTVVQDSHDIIIPTQNHVMQAEDVEVPIPISDNLPQSPQASNKSTKKSVISRSKIHSEVSNHQNFIQEQIPIPQVTIQPESLPQQSSKSSRVSRQSRENPASIMDSEHQEAINSEQFSVPLPLSKKSSKKTEVVVVVQEPSNQTLIKLTEEEIRSKYQDNEDYQYMVEKIPMSKNEFERALKKGLPRIFPDEDEIARIENDHTRLSQIRQLIIDKIHDFQTANIEPSGEDPSLINMESFLEDQEVKQLFQKLMAFKIEGCSLNSKDLRQLCYTYIVTEHLPSISSSLSELHIDEMIGECATRKAYGQPPKSANTFLDKTPLALWSWEISNYTLLEPVSETQIKKARAQKLIIGKKIVKLHNFIEMCSDYTTFDSPEKIAKVHDELKAYNLLKQKENSSEWINRKRKHHEIGSTTSADLLDKNSSNQHKQQRSQNTSSGKKIKPNEEYIQSELPSIIEVSESPVVESSGIQGTMEIRKSLAIQELAKPKVSLFSFFSKTDKSVIQDNPSLFQIRSKEEIKRNPFLQYAARCQTESQKVQQACTLANLPSDWFDTESIMNKFKVIRSICEQQDQVKVPKPKNIQIQGSSMYYSNVIFDKQSRILNCKAPFEKDPTVIDYDQDSEEEWEEVHGENLDDDQLLDEENMEVVEDEVELLSLPSVGVSNDMKRHLAFRSQYCKQTLQFADDAEELREEGFIVPDDYLSENSDEISSDEPNQNLKYKNTRQLLAQAVERQENRVKQRKTMTPYILKHSSACDLGDFKAVCLFKRRVKHVTPSVSRFSFSNAGASTGDETCDFPLSVEKPKVEEIKLQIKDVVNDLVSYGHATSLSKKQLIDDIKGRFPDLKKSHIEGFVKESFEKAKRHLDSKVRLFARVDALEKYEVEENLIQELPKIYEEKLQADKLAAALALANNPQPVQSTPNKETSHDDPSSMNPPAPRRQSAKPRQSNTGIAANKASKKSSSKSIGEMSNNLEDQHNPNRLSEVQPISQQIAADPISERQSNVAVVGTSSDKDQFEAQLSIKSSSNIYQPESIEEQAVDYNLSLPQKSTNEDADVEMVNEEEEKNAIVNHDEGSWINITANNQQAQIETPAFNSKLFDLNLPSTEQKNQYFDEDPQIQLSQHAIVLPYNAEEGDLGQPVMISQQSFNRSIQQNQSTPIQNFRALRSRDISVNHSQNGMEDEPERIVTRLRQDSMETDKGNPLQNNAPVTSLEEMNGLNVELDMLNQQHLIPNHDSFNSPPSHTHNQTKTNFENLNQIAQFEESKNQELPVHTMRGQSSFGAPSELPHQLEEEKVQFQDVTFVIDQSDNQVEDPDLAGTQQTASKVRVPRSSTLINQNTESRQLQQDPPPRRSKRLESKHRLLQQQLHFTDDELNHAYSQDSHHLADSHQPTNNPIGSKNHLSRQSRKNSQI